MKKISELIVKKRWLILIITLLLMIPSILGYVLTNINYDILVYLPSDIETIKGEKILTDDFDTGAFSIIITNNMNSREILKLEEDIKNVDSVEHVISINDLTGTQVPISILPSELVDKIKKNDSTLIFVTFENSTSDDKTLDAVSTIREIVNKDTKVGGMSAMVLDTKELFNSEMTLYVIIAVILCVIVLELFLDSYLVPILLMLNIGVAIIFNMGSNIIFGNISYITKAIAAVLQLGVTTDFSIFLYHKYESLKKISKSKEEAMSSAINETFTSVFGSSLTTIAGFLALCTMKLTLGVDIGLVMAKGVFIGVICVLTLFPALLIVFDKVIDKTKHKELLPKFNRVKSFVLKNYIPIFIVFIVLLVPAYFAQSKTPVYYKLDESIPDNYGYSMATKTLKEDFNIVSQEILIVPKTLEDYKVNQMIEEIRQIDGIDLIISTSNLTKYGLTNIIPDDIKNMYETDKYKLVLITSDYDIATDELNNQIEIVNNIVKRYDKDIIVAGEGPLMKDLVDTTNTDFTNVNYTSIGVIFVLMLIVLKSLTLPILLVIAIEFAIFINMGVPYFTGTEIPFIASVVIGTIQLGATIDYAILMTTRYLEERKNNKDSKTAIKISLDNSVSSIFVSAMCFFSATIGVGIVSKIDMIGSLCRLISRGALISMLVVILIVPSILLIFDKLIIKTTLLNKKGNDKMKKINKALSCALILTLMLEPMMVMALSSEETVYTKLDSNGNIVDTTVSKHLINDEHKDKIEDVTDLKNIINTNGDNTYTIDNNKIIWNSNGNDIYYQGTTNKELPISMKLTYKLDGKEIELDDLIGKSGHVEINIKYTNNLKNIVKVNGKNETLYTPFVVATVTSIPNINNKNINTSTGKVIDNGLGYTIVSISTPGLYESLNINELKDLNDLTISYDTTKFELSSIYSVITPKLLEPSDLDILDKVNNLYSSVNKLQTSINQISTGSSLIKENMDVITEKLNEIKIGAVTIDQGLTQILTELKNVNTKLNSNDINNKLNQLNVLIQTNENTINTLTSTSTTITSTYLDKTNFDLSTMKYGDIENLEPIIGKEKVKQLISVKYQYENNSNTSELIKLIATNNEALKELKKSLEETTKQISELINTLSTYLTKLEKGVNDLSNGITKLNDGTNLLDNKMGELNNGINTFNSEGINKLTSYTYRLKQVSGKVKALVKLSEDYKSFSMNDKNTESNTKFIIIVDGKSVPKEKEKIEVVKKKETFWDRIINLFK